MPPNSDPGYINKAFELCQDNVKQGFTNNKQTSIAWSNLQYEVGQLNNWRWSKKIILRRLNGHFSAGTLNSFLGPSGAGKTTLLNCLSGSTANSAIYIAAAAANSSTSAISYYIRQHINESIAGQLTVRQILYYAFAFKNSSNNGSSAMEGHLAAIMAALMLPTELLDRRFALCSGGEQRRVAIAQELMSLTAPSFLFIDEPTTGLDSAAAFEVMLCLQKLAKSQNITIITSIHSPNNETLNLFDQLYVLARGGICLYSGPPNQLKSHIEKLTGLSVAPEQPPIEVLLKIACADLATSPAASALASYFSSASVCSDLSALTHQPNGFPRPRKAFSFSDFTLQLSRLFQILIATNYKTIGFTLLLYVLMYLTFSSIYSSTMAAAEFCYPLDPTSSNTTCATQLEQNNLASENNMFHCYNCLLVGFIMMSTSAVVFSPLVKMFRNEAENYWYSLSVFYFASSLITILEMTFYSIIASLLAYFITAQHAGDEYSINGTRLMLYICFIWLLCIYMQSLGQLIGSILMSHTELALIISQVLYIILITVNDYFVDTEKTGDQFFIQFANLVALKYLTKGFVYIFYGFEKCNTQSEFSSFMLRYKVVESELGEYVLRVLVNVVLFRVMTILFLYFKFGNFTKTPIGRLGRWLRQKLLYSETVGLNLNEFSNNQIVLEMSTQPRNDDATIISVNQQINDSKDFIRGQILLAWRHLTLLGDSSLYETQGRIDKKRQARLILRSLNGQLKFGTLHALMGTSGAGKTSFLKVLNGQSKTRLTDSTAFYLSKLTSIRSCFITQEVSAHLLPGLTAKQSLVYASMLKNVEVGGVDHEQIALKWLQELDLTHTVDTKVEKCSGGERKRLAVALELTAIEMPNLICIDEPTSGLDTNSAEIVIATLRKLTETHPLTIVTSIHQPTTEILYMFDQLYVLARGGLCIYCGPPNQIQVHLNLIQEQEKPPSSQFPIETLIKYSCLPHPNPTTTQLAQLTSTQILKQTSTESLLNTTQSIPDGIQQNRPRFSFCSVYLLSRRYMAHICGSLWPLLLAFIICDLGYACQLQIFFPPEIALPTGCVSLDEDLGAVCQKTPEGLLEDHEIYENYKYNFFYICIFLFLLLLQSSLIFGKELAYFLVEHRNGWYSSGSFYFMKSIFEMAPVPIIITIYVTICDIYSPIIPNIFWPLVGILSLGALAIQGMGHTFSLLSGGSVTRLTVLSIAAFILFCQISNFFIPLQRLHYLYRFIANFSLSRFVFEGALLLQYGFNRCNSKQINLLLYSMDIDSGHYYHCLLMLIFNLVLYRIIAIYLLICKATPVQNRKERSHRIEEYRVRMLKE